jgi:hypothetical protein
MELNLDRRMAHDFEKGKLINGDDEKLLHLVERCVSWDLWLRRL